MARKPTPAPAEQPTPTAMRYVGAGDFVSGVPTRDLTAAEWAQLSDEQRACAAALYEPVVPAEE